MVTNRLNSAGNDERLAQVIAGYLLAAEAGQTPDRQELLHRHPDLASDLIEFFAGQEQFGRLVEPLRLRPPEPEAPLGDFRIVREIGRGGMGIVYEAIQISLGRRVALKVLPFAAALDSRQLQRFKNEAQAAAHLHHQNIVPVYAVGCERGVHLYAMQYIEGHTLAELIAGLRENAECRNPNDERNPNAEAQRSNGEGTGDAGNSDTPFGLRNSTIDLHSSFGFRHSSFSTTAARLALQAAEALEHAHALGVVHRDIKPANLLVDVQGNLWVTDFGLAHVQTDARLTLTGDLVGTLRYMSPEQALAQPVGVSHRTDLYSLGATLYELLTLQPAFNGSDRQELLRQIAFEEPQPPRQINKAVPADLETIVLKAMAKNPAERYATAQDLADDLRRFLDDKPIRARRPSPLEQARKWGRRHRRRCGRRRRLRSWSCWRWRAAPAGSRASTPRGRPRSPLRSARPCKILDNSRRKESFLRRRQPLSGPKRCWPAAGGATSSSSACK